MKSGFLGRFEGKEIRVFHDEKDLIYTKNLD